jgi:hypothetical protein
MEAILDQYAVHRVARLPHIFQVFGLSYVPGDDVANANTVNHAFVGPEHGQLNVSITKDQADAVRDDLVALGFARPETPQHRDHLACLKLGAVSGANARRSRLRLDLEAEGYTIGDDYDLSGQRPLEVRDGDPIELIKGINPEALDHPWIQEFIVGKPVMNNWGLTEFHVWVGIEIATDPTLEIEEIVEISNDTPIAGVPARDILEVRFRRSNGKLLVVHNAAAIERFTPSGGKAPSRHTTISCTLEVLERRPDLLVTGQDYLYISGNPHAGRMVDDSRRELAKVGRRPNLHLAATALLPSHDRFVPLSLHELGQREFNAHVLPLAS